MAIAWYFIGLIRIVWYEKKINKIHQDFEEGKAEIRKKSIAMPFIDGQIVQLEEKIKPELERLERKRRFILDKLPLLKK